MPRIYLSPPHLTGRELELVKDAIDSNWVAPLGPHVDAFEEELAAQAGVAHARALSSGTAALHLALIVLGLEPGDEIACSSFTFSASANPIRYIGGTPVFVDCDDTWTMDPALLERALAERPIKAVVAVDLYGQCCDYDPIRELCAAHGVPLVQDAAESLGATYKNASSGGQGDVTAFSFNGNKIITTSGGGALLSNDGAKIEHARKLSTQARDAAPHYQHTELGFNYRLSNLLAAVGRAQLEVLPDRVQARRRINARYRELLPDLEFMSEAAYGTSNCWLTCILVDDPERIRLALEAEDIESRPLWKPMHLQPFFADAPVYGGDVSAGLFARGLCLPSGSALSDDDQQRIAEITRAST